MDAIDRFLRYVTYDTQSDEHSDTSPSTEKQKVLGQALADELGQLGLHKAHMDEHGYVYAWLPATPGSEGVPCVGLIAHMDTSPDAPGAGVNPRIVRYEGGDIVLNEEKGIVMRAAEFESLAKYQGQELIVTDGTTLLGADDKAGVAEIMSAMEYLVEHPELPHGRIAVCFTPDEEVGQGADHFDVEGFGAAVAYTVDGGELGEIEYENFNAASAKVEVYGRNIHPGSAKNQMVNAQLIAMEFQSMLPVHERPECTAGYEGFALLTDMNGTVEHSQLRYIIRDHDMDLFQKKKKHMEDMARIMNIKYGYEAVSLKIQDSYFNMKEKIEPHRFLIDNVLKVYEKLGIQPQIQPIRGGTDGAQLSFKGLPCPNLGTGDHNCHGHFEFTCIQAMEKSVEVIVELIKLWK